MTFYHYVETLTNDAGDILVGYPVKLKDGGGSYATLYSDQSATPIVAVSGIADAGVSDSDGVVSIYVTDGTYDIEVFDKNDNDLLLKRILAVPMYGFDSASDALAAAASAAAAAASAAQVAIDADTVAADKLLTEGFKDDAEAAAAAAQAVSVTGAVFTAGGPVAVATTANITLSGEQTIDGVATSTSRILVKNQSAPEENGIYVTAAGAWSRAADMDDAAEVADTLVYVSGGSVSSGLTYATYSTVTTLGTDAVAWVEAFANDGLQAEVDALDGVVPYAADSTYYPSPVAKTNASSNVQYASDGYWERTTATGRFIGRISLTTAQKAMSSIEVHLPATGTFSVTPHAELKDGTTLIGSTVTGTLVNGEYIMTVPISGTPTIIEVDWSTASDGRAQWPYLLETGHGLTKIATTTEAGKWVIEEWHRELFKRSGNLLTSLPEGSLWNVSSGGSPVSLPDGKTITIASGYQTYCAIPVHGLAESGDYFAMLFRLHSPATAFKGGSLGGQDWNGGSLGAVDQLWFADNDYCIAFCKAEDGNAEVAQTIRLRFETIADDEIPATAIEIEAIGLFNIPNLDWVGRLFADPVRLMERLAQWQETPGYVSSAADADAERTYASLPLAVRAGHKRIYCGENQRLDYALCLPVPGQHVRMTGGAWVRFSDEYASGDCTVSSGDANVFYIAPGSDPTAIVEVDGGEFYRLDIPNASDTALYSRAANEAAVQANERGSWYGAGGDGTALYFHPRGGTVTGKTFEVPKADYGFVVPRGGDATIEQGAGAVSGFTRNVMAVATGNLRLLGGAWRTTGYNRNIISPAASSNATVTVGKNALITDAGNDGYNSNTAGGYVQTLVIEGGARFAGNWNDGIATSHSTGRTVLVGSGRLDCSDNGKQGIVTSGLTDCDLPCVVARGNRNQDVLWQHSVAGGDRINIGFAEIDTLYIDLSGSATSSGRITGLITTLTGAGSVTVTRLATV